MEVLIGFLLGIITYHVVSSIVNMVRFNHFMSHVIIEEEKEED